MSSSTPASAAASTGTGARLLPAGGTVLTGEPDPMGDAPLPGPRPDPDAPCTRVLVVEDDPSLALLLERVLSKNGYGVTLATTGEDGLREALELDVDAVVLDVNIPAPDGLEVCRRLRAAGRGTPVLMLTAQGTVRDRVAGLDAGADDYLTKPFALAELAARLRALTRRGPGVAGAPPRD